MNVFNYDSGGNFFKKVVVIVSEGYTRIVGGIERRIY